MYDDDDDDDVLDNFELQSKFLTIITQNLYFRQFRPRIDIFKSLVQNLKFSNILRQHRHFPQV